MSEPCLFGPNGQPISSKFLKSAENGSRRLPPETLRPLDPLKKLITNRDFETVSFLADKVDMNFGVAEGIVAQKSMYSVTDGWAPIFLGGAGPDDKAAHEWGDLVTDWLVNQWFPYCDVRGEIFDFNTGLYLDSIETDVRGESITIQTRSEDGEGRWPMLQAISCRRIGQWDNATKVVGGKYDGADIENGVIKNRAGRPIAFRIRGENRGEFEDIDTAHIIRTFEPRRVDQGRGLPLFASVLDSWRSMAQSHEWEEQCMLIASAIGLLEYNDTGDASDGFSLDDPLNTANLPASTGAPEFKNLYGGLIRYFKANGGGKLEQFLHQRPGSDWESFNDRGIRVCCVAANWPYSLVWKKDGTNGTATRADQNTARKSIADRQSLLRYPALRKIRYAIGVAMQKGPNGEPAILPPYPGKDIGGFLKWDFSMPPLMTIDEGNDRQNDREDANYGWLTDEQKALRMGTTAAKLHTQRDREVDALLTRAETIAAKHKDKWPVDTILTLLRQTTSNANAPGGRFGSSFEEDTTTQTTTQP
jgi:hypothetical protein